MKTLIRLLFFAVGAGLAGQRAHAQLLAYDDAAAYNAAGNTWTNGMNFGFGFQPWVLVKTNVGGYSGHFIGNGGPIATINNSAWGLYGNGTVTNTSSPGNAAVAFRAFSNSLPANAVFKIKWRNLGIGGDLNPPYHIGGFALRNGNANASVDDYFTGVRLAFYYIGGIDDNFRIWDANGATATGLGFATGPFELNVLLTGSDTYRLIVKNPAGTTVITNYEGTLAGSGTIDSVALYNFQCDGDQVFNNMAISTTSLLPPEVRNFTPTNGSVYVPASTAISFQVVSEFSGVSTNNIVLTLNGTNVTGLSFSGSATNWTVTKTGALADNREYTAVVTV
ncbi:MAG: Ig-like domain-containing protein, partial [Verrucomicrobiales bacterium]|nr:Ig-like domain-containing protein [Verrucomicrobiales bacterium]